MRTPEIRSAGVPPIMLRTFRHIVLLGWLGTLFTLGASASTPRPTEAMTAIKAAVSSASFLSDQAVPIDDEVGDMLLAFDDDRMSSGKVAIPEASISIRQIDSAVGSMGARDKGRTSSRSLLHLYCVLLI